MLILLLFAFISGLVTILAPCIWPLLPIVLSSSATGGKSKSLGITFGIMISFSIVTLTISTLVSIFHFDPDILRKLAVVVIGFLGLSLIIPALSANIETLTGKIMSFWQAQKIGLGASRIFKLSRDSGQARVTRQDGFPGGLLTGLSLGVVWSPCAGPILATIAALAITQTLSFSLVMVMIAYVTGVGIPLFFFSFFGSQLFTKSRFLSPYLGRIQKVFGIVMILTAILIYTNYDKVLQVKLLDAFPSYSNFLGNFENNSIITSELKKLKGAKDMPIPTVGVFSNISNISDVSNISKLPFLGKAPDFAGGNNWLNPPAGGQVPTMQQLRGKVVLVDFWTYTCINCIRTLPHVVGWYEKYKDKGFVVVGVHTPEFEFEKKTENVANAIAQYKIHYPVVQDNDFKIWNAYENRYWPAKYLIDANGNIRFTHFGEGEYDTTEMNIKKLLEEAGNKIDLSIVDMPDETPHTRLTPETYLGSARIDDTNLNFEGMWEVEREYRKAGKGSSLELNFTASKVFLVIHPATQKDAVKVYLDGKLVDQTVAGEDVKDGAVTVTVPRLYNLIDLKGKTENHNLKLDFHTEGTEVFAFTFG